MDPASLAADAMNVVSPFLVQFGADAAKEVASSAGKLVWDWIKGKLTSPAGQEAVAEFERAPTGAGHKQMLEGALTKALANDPEALAALTKLLGEQGVAVSTQTANVIGDSNKTAQASHGSTVNIR
jgi:hypothetical protein